MIELPHLATMLQSKKRESSKSDLSTDIKAAKIEDACVAFIFYVLFLQYR